MGGGAGDPAGDQVAAPLQCRTQRRGEKRLRLFFGRGTNLPQRAAGDQAELAGRIAERQLQLIVSGGETRITAGKLGGAAHGCGESSPSAEPDSSSGSRLGAACR
jgi:hypothetical protein